MRRTLIVNGTPHELDVAADESLLHVLRDRLGLTGTKDACSAGECGACTVLINSRARVACLTLASVAHGEIETVEGLGSRAPWLQEAFATEGGFQCGFCTPGQLMSCEAIARRLNPDELPDGRAPRHQLSGNICRCTGYAGIQRALEHAPSPNG